jgi:hypothetical protein
MKNFKQTTIVIQNLMVDDYVKVAGVLYRVHQIEMIGDAYIIQLHNARRPKIQALMTLESNTLMKIWNQK